MNEKVQIPALKDIKGLPVTFRLMSYQTVNENPRKDLFFYVEAYQGMALAEPFEKPYSKIINWQAWHE